jgi:putative membrane-bound dehydrogenase-like protein
MELGGVMSIRFAFVLLPLLLLKAWAAEPRVDPNDLPRVPPTAPADAIKTFQIHKGLKIELVASEPLTESPVGICFDEDGRLFVVEMRGYPDRQEVKLGRIKLLEDTKGDGHYDKATIYADKLGWPTGALWYDGGLYVTASPDVIRLKSSTGSGPADQRRVVFTGFGSGMDPLNVQGLVNGLSWGLDGRIHGTPSFNGGMISRPGASGPAINIRGKDFAFDPRTDDLTTENGGGQHGLSFDSFGRQFVCMNSKPVETFFYDTRYAARNPLYAMPPALADVNADGPDVFRISPEEAWRVMRTKWRVAGKATGPIEGGGRAGGYFTGVSGITMYTGDALPPEFRDNAFIGEVANNLLHREVISPDGVGVVAHRASDEQSAEFLASTDIWFRPVQMANGPDGALYIVDMYREVIEHPWSLPDEIRSHLDLHSGMERGRIWRIVPEGFTSRPAPHLSKASTAQLVALLEHPNGWHRDTAARLLFERNDPAAVPLMTKMLSDSKSAVGRFRALCALVAQNAISEQHLLAALHDSDARVRERGVLLCEPLLRAGKCSAALRDALAEGANAPAISVRYQVAFSLGEAPTPERAKPLAAIVRRDVADSWMRSAVLSSLAEDEAAMFAELASGPDFRASEAGREFMEQLAALIGKRAKPDEVAQVVDLITAQSAKESLFAFALARSLREGLGRECDELGGERIKPILDRARTAAGDDSSPEPLRSEAIRLLGTTTFKEAGQTLVPLLETSRSQETQLAAVGALDELNDAEVGPVLVKHFSALPPQVRAAALSALLKRPDRAMALLNAIEAGALHSIDVPSAQAAFLLKHPDAKVRALAAKLLKPAGHGLDAAIRALQPALDLEGDATKGHAIYLQRCSACHHLGGEGFAVGPDLTTVRNDGKAKALVNIVDPNREVAPNYVAYNVETRAGESLVGVISETGSGVTVHQPFGKETTVLRADIKRIESQHMSLMPEGIAEGLKPQDMADLLEFVFTAGTKSK